MNLDNWTVKRAGGEELGCIRKLMIDTNTRQLSYADVALTHTNRLVRLPWTELDVRHDGIFLKSTRMPLVTATSPSPDADTLDILDVPTRVPGKIGQSRHTLSFPRTSSRF